MANETIKLGARELRAKGRKKCWSPSQRFWMEVSLYLTTPFVKTSITPNMITVSWIILEIFSAFLLIKGEYWFNIIAIILFNFVAYLGDHIDGNLARMKEKFSLIGPYLEQLGIFFGTPIFFLGLALGNYSRFGNTLFLILSLAGVSFWLFEKLIRINPAWFGEKDAGKISYVYKKASLASFKPKKKNLFIIEIFRRGQPFNFLFFCIIFDYTELVSLIYSAFFFLEFVRKLSYTLINLKKASKTQILNP